MKESNLTIIYKGGKESLYSSSDPGDIEIYQISDIHILRIYFPDLTLQSTNIEGYVEESTELMLANYPVQVNHIDKIENQVIQIQEGWSGSKMYTMLSIWDGEPIDNNTIDIHRYNSETYNIKWRGGADYQFTKFLKVIFEGVAIKTQNAITPLCLSDQEIIEINKDSIL